MTVLKSVRAGYYGGGYSIILQTFYGLYDFCQEQVCYRFILKTSREIL